jgi:Tfp pilus assembly protein PilN
MIEINLLPHELRTRREKSSSGIDPKYFFYAAAAVVGFLIVVQLLLLFAGVVRSSQLVVLSASWKKMEPQRKELEAVRQQFDTVSKDAQILQQLSVKRINWSEKLRKLSLNLPSGIWFNDISVSPTDFILKGSAVSQEKTEMALINQFIGALKKDAEFLKDFTSFDLNSFQVRNLGGYDIVDFILAGALKTK